MPGVNEDQRIMQRRSFVKRVSGIAAAIAGAVAGIGLFKQFYPPSAGRKQKVKVGKLYEYPVDTFTFLDEHNVYVYRDHEGVRAVSAVCTHLGCTLEKSSDGFICPCHGSCYNDSGEVLSGPAPRDLAWYDVSRSQDGRLLIDLEQKVESDYKFKIS